MMIPKYYYCYAVILFSIWTFPIAVTSLRCGVCSSGGAGGGLAQLKSQFPGLGKIPSCGTGGGEEEQPLALDCPRDFQAGCLTQTKAKQVVKLCSNIPVHDCKSANGVEYCYCRGELCNIGGSLPQQSLPVPIPIPTPAPSRPLPTPPTSAHHEDDDEDDLGVEGSGGENTKTQSPTKSVAPTKKPENPKTSQSSIASLCPRDLAKLALLYLFFYISHTIFFDFPI